MSAIQTLPVAAMKLEPELNPTGEVKFDASKHLDYTPPYKIWQMTELGFPESQGLSPMCVSEPFRLFSDEAVQQMRQEILSKKVWSQHRFSSKYAQCQLRGYARDCAPFIYEAWKSPKTLAIISKIAGIDLVPIMDYEIAHINISGADLGQLSPMPEDSTEKSEATQPTDQVVQSIEEKNDAIVSWHNDSYPFVCVTMLSDCTNMVGGETALRTGSGEIVKVRGPQMGSAVILQGRYVDHQALRAIGGSERISMVTSFRAKNSAVRDETVLKLVRPISDIHDLYGEYSEYRFGMLEDRFRQAKEKMAELLRTRGQFSTSGTRSFIDEQIQFLEQTKAEIIDHEGARPRQG